MADANQRAKIEAKKVYLKDASFESPGSPQVFAQGEINPELDVQMTMTHQRIEPEQNYYEVVLSATVTASQDGDALFLAEVQEAGIFEISHVPEANLEAVLETACPHILLPFARESLASMISKGGFPQLLLSPVNFQALYNQKKAKEARSVETAGTMRPN
ncbi:MAG: protein-export chaperone SecB [bacterium]